MFIEKYDIFVKDTLSKKAFKFTLEENDSREAHKKALSRVNNYQEILKIVTCSGSKVYDINEGFSD